MARIDVNLDGQIFGRWTVLETIPHYKNGKTYCLCRCECGTTKYILRSTLLNGDSKSCGCLARERIQDRCRKNCVGQVFGDIVVLEMLYGYKNNRTYCKCLCTCGNECLVSMCNLTSGHTKSCGCRAYELAWDTRGRSNLVGLVFGKLTVVEMLYGYNGGKQTYCKCLCECGTETIVGMSNLVSGRTTSCGCFETASRYNRIHYIELLGQKFGMLTVVEKTNLKAINGCVIWKCRCDCGNTTYATTTELRLYRKTSCGCSRYSNMEHFIANILSKHNINYIPQAQFTKCRNIFPLRFDFYLYDYNTVIEFDGEQHNKPVDFFGGEEGLARRVVNDKIKNDYCSQNNINMIRLPHTLTTQQIEEIIIHIWNP